jgi:hypothetical protein
LLLKVLARIHMLWRWQLFFYTLKQMTCLKYRDQPALRNSTMSIVCAAFTTDFNPDAASQAGDDAATSLLVQHQIDKDCRGRGSEL